MDMNRRFPRGVLARGRYRPTLEAMISRTLVALTLVLAFSAGLAAREDVPLPSADFVFNFDNFPQAWQVSRGRGVTIAVVRSDGGETPRLLERLVQAAPEAKVIRVDADAFLERPAGLATAGVVFLWEPLADAVLAKADASLALLLNKGVACIVPAAFGKMDKAGPSKEWIGFCQNASRRGAVVVGACGRAYQLGAVEFWKKLPVSTFVMFTRVDGDDAFQPDFLIDEDLSIPAYQAAAGAALLKSREPGLTPAAVQDRFIKTGRALRWVRLIMSDEAGRPSMSCRPFLSQNGLDEFLRRFRAYRPVTADDYRGWVFDAGLLLGRPPLGNGEWSLAVLRVREAQAIATGKTVTVAILDHGFLADDWSLKGRIVQPGSVVPGMPALSGTASHGTWMARDLVRVAPGAMIMPVVIYGENGTGADEYIRGIDYAVKNGAAIVSISHQPVAKGRQTDLDAAIARAAAKGVTVVYIHYEGERTDVVQPGPIEFGPTYEGRPLVYVIGTNFIDEASFPYTWGVSQTAPIVSGVIAMMKEVNPELMPAEVRTILLDSHTRSAGAFNFLDAVAAVAKARQAAKPSR